MSNGLLQTSSRSSMEGCQSMFSPQKQQEKPIMRLQKCYFLTILLDVCPFFVNFLWGVHTLPAFPRAARRGLRKIISHSSFVPFCVIASSLCLWGRQVRWKLFLSFPPSFPAPHSEGSVIIKIWIFYTSLMNVTSVEAWAILDLARRASAIHYVLLRGS